MRMEIDAQDNIDVVFDSLEDQVEAIRARPDIVKYRSGQMRDEPEFYGAANMEQVFKLVETGLPDLGIKALGIANERVATLEREIDMPAFASFYNVSGADVDVARYLSGEPENMIDYNMVMTPRAGRIICLVISVDAMGWISTDTIEARGIQAMALVFAIEKIGFQVEMWADIRSKRPGSSLRVRTMVKAAGAPLDVERAMYAFTSPTMLRGLGFAACHLIPPKYHAMYGVGAGYGSVDQNPHTRGYPDGALMIKPPAVNGDKGRTIVEDSLRELGII